MLTSHEDHFHKLLEEIEAGQGRSQRTLARELGIALGLTNLLLRQIVRKGWIKMVHIKRNRVAYLITPAGLAEKARMSRNFLRKSARTYATARDLLLDAFCGLAETRPAHGRPCRLAFYGAGEIAEIGYVCLQSTRLNLVGVVDATRTEPFFGFPIRRLEDLAGCQLAGVRFDRLVIMDLDNPVAVERAVAKAGVPAEAVFWLADWRRDPVAPPSGDTVSDDSVEQSRQVTEQSKRSTQTRVRDVGMSAR